VQVADDHAFLNEQVRGQSVSQWLEKMATNWEQRRFGFEPNLADYGGSAGSFLECVSAYTHGVAALQAFNVRMMRDVAALGIYEHSVAAPQKRDLLLGVSDVAVPISAAAAIAAASRTAKKISQLLSQANATANAMKVRLYVHGDPPVTAGTANTGGYWSALQPNTTRVEVRHIATFSTSTLSGSPSVAAGRTRGAEMQAI
jgi:hypothetical protein